MDGLVLGFPIWDGTTDASHLAEPTDFQFSESMGSDRMQYISDSGNHQLTPCPPRVLCTRGGAGGGEAVLRRGSARGESAALPPLLPMDTRPHWLPPLH